MNEIYFTPQKAAEECGVARSTIVRAYQTGKIIGAIQENGKWKLPLSGLLSAGFHPGKMHTPKTLSMDSPENITTKLNELEQTLILEREKRNSLEKLLIEVEKRANLAEKSLLMLESGNTLKKIPNKKKRWWSRGE